MPEMKLRSEITRSRMGLQRDEAHSAPSSLANLAATSLNGRVGRGAARPARNSDGAVWNGLAIRAAIP